MRGKLCLGVYVLLSVIVLTFIVTESSYSQARKGVMDYIYEGLPAIPEPTLEPGKTALVIVDMQYLDAHPDFGWGKVLKDRGGADLGAWFFDRLKATVIPNIQALQRVCRAAGINIIFMKIEMHKSDRTDAGLLYRLRQFDSPKGSKNAEILEEIAPLPDEIVIPKTTTGAFNSTNIDFILRNLGIETLIITGVNTNACVEMTSKDAADRGYRVIIPEDATAAITGQEVHKSTIRRLDSGLVSVKTTAELVGRLSKVKK